MNLRNISAWSIRNPIVPIVLFVGLLIVGVISFIGLDIQNEPDIEFPGVIISISQPGASPVEIENQITQRVETAVQNLDGVDEVVSTASEGNNSTFVQFNLGHDVDQAVNDVKNAVDQERGNLPEDILEPSITKVTATEIDLAVFTASAEDMTLEQLSWFVDDKVTKSLLTIDGMGEVERTGGVDREIRVLLIPERMQALGINATQINGILRQLNINAAGGQTEIAGSRQSVRVLGNAKTAFELSQTQIATNDGRTIRLSDIAKVTDGFSEPDSVAKVRGKQVVTFSFTRSKGASDINVYDKAEAELDRIRSENPEVEFERLFTTVEFSRDQYTSSMAAMIEGSMLAIVVVFLFLRDWRATFISALAIPLSAIPTFWFLNLMGFTLNQMSLLALGLVAGVLVDDAIVEIENIVRHMRMGKTAYQASIDAADEIGLAVVATTFSIVAVFLPVALMPGFAGQYFKVFGFTVVIAVLMSLAVARMITPMIAAYFLRAKGEQEHASGAWIGQYAAILKWSLSPGKGTEIRQNGGWFSTIFSYAFDHRVWVMGIGALTLLITAALFYFIPKEFFPQGNEDFIGVDIEVVPGSTLEQTEAVSAKVGQLIYEDPNVKTALERVFTNKAEWLITMKADRDATTQEFADSLTPKLQTIPDARIFMRNLGQPGGGNGTGRPISIMLVGSDAQVLADTAATLVEQMKGLDTLVAPRIAGDLQRSEIIVTPRFEIASQMGVTTAALSESIRIATLGDIDQNSAKFSLGERQIPIRVLLPRESRKDFSTLENLPVPITGGGSVPLSRVADISIGSGPTAIRRFQQQRRIFVGADLAPGVVEGTADAQIKQLQILQNLPNGISERPFGLKEWQAEMEVNFVVAIIAGTALVFAVLVLLYQRIMSPLVNMGSLLLAPLGGLIALILVGQALSMPVFIGILLLFGIVAKNSILLVDFALEQIAEGKEKTAAIIEAGRKRAQPIVMTTVAMTAGMIPTAISLSGDGAWRAPMGTVVIGGLILSTLLTLLIVPAGFSLASGIETRAAKLMGRQLTYKDGDEGDDTAVQPAE